MTHNVFFYAAYPCKVSIILNMGLIRYFLPAPKLMPYKTVIGRIWVLICFSLNISFVFALFFYLYSNLYFEKTHATQHNIISLIFILRLIVIFGVISIGVASDLHSNREDWWSPTRSAREISFSLKVDFHGLPPLSNLKRRK